jgi:hypothetical protein
VNRNQRPSPISEAAPLKELLEQVIILEPILARRYDVALTLSKLLLLLSYLVPPILLGNRVCGYLRRYFDGLVFYVLSATAHRSISFGSTLSEYCVDVVGLHLQILISESVALLVFCDEPQY